MKSKLKAVTHQHEKKLYNLRTLQHYVDTKTKQHPVKQIIYNFSLYVLDEEIALSCGLDQHIPSSLNKPDIDAELK